MQYECRTIPLVQLIPGSRGFIKPLCTTCQARDCENPIQYKDVSIAGVIEKQRCWVSWNNISIVIDCKGYTR